MSLPKHASLPLLLAATAFSAHAQTAPSNKIQAQYWIDVATANMTIPGMQDQGGGGSSLFGALMGGAMSAAMPPGMGGGKSMHTELWVRARPQGVEGSHAIPAGMNMGAALPLVPIKPVQSQPGTPAERGDSPAEKPKGRILLYWGCGEEVRKGQPKILDLASQNYAEFAQFFASSRGGRASRGVQGKPGDAVWPNERDNKPVPENASLAGGHAVSGDAVPATLRFSVDAANDFLPKAQLQAKGAPKDSIALSWNTMDHAKGYFLQAQGGKGEQGDKGADLILWSSSELPDAGWSMMDYQSPSQVAKWIQQKVVLAPTVSTCAIPKGIFAQADGAMVNMIAYGPEFNASHPARPEKAPKDWQPDWTARIRVKSTGMTMLGMADGGDERAPQRDGRQQEQKKQEGQQLPNPVNIIKGLFGS